MHRLILRLLVALAVIGSLLAGPTARAASFDCTKSTTPVEQRICADPHLSAADTDLAALYGQVLAAAPDPEAMRRDQREWLTQTRNHAETSDALLRAYSDRDSALRSRLAAYKFRQETFDAAQAEHDCVPLPTQKGACKIDAAGRLPDAPGPQLAYQLQTYAGGTDQESRGVVVLSAAAGGKVRPVAWLANPGARYETPKIVAHDDTRLLYLPGTSGGSGDFPDDALLAWRDGAWHDVDTQSWLDSLFRKLPKGLTAAKGIYPDWATMTARTALWRTNDPNCCPGGGQARIKLRLDGDRIQLQSVTTGK